MRHLLFLVHAQGQLSKLSQTKSFVLREAIFYKFDTAKASLLFQNLSLYANNTQQSTINPLMYTMLTSSILYSTTLAKRCTSLRTTITQTKRTTCVFKYTEKKFHRRKKLSHLVQHVSLLQKPTTLTDKNVVFSSTCWCAQGHVFCKRCRCRSSLRDCAHSRAGPALQKKKENEKEKRGSVTRT